MDTPPRDALDDKVNAAFSGKVVRKDLVRNVKVGANVPVFVLEFLLGKYCASSDPVAIEMGLQVVNDTLAENYIRPDESMKAQSKVMDQGRHSFIDKVKVRVADGERWAEAVNFGDRYMHIPPEYPRDYERLLTGGVWAQIDVKHNYDDESKGKRSFWISRLDPIQIATFNLAEYRSARTEFTTDEWTDFMIRSMGYEPTEMDRRLKLLFLTRLIPLAERNYNLVELGPRGTGKSYVIQEISPYASLLTGPTTVANLFGHMSRTAEGHGADLGRRRLRRGRRPAEDAQRGHHHDEDLLRVGHLPAGHRVSLGRRQHRHVRQHQPARRGDGAVSGHLFEPMPDIIRDDMAFIDRLHYYLPGWEVPKMRTEHFTDHYGFVVDYLAEALRELRKQNYTEMLDRHFSLGSHLNAATGRPSARRCRGWSRSSTRTAIVSEEDLAETRRVRDRGPAPGEGAAQEDGLVRVLPDLVQLHRRGDRRGALRRCSRAGRARPDRAGSAGARLRVRGGGRLGRHGRAVPDRGVSVCGDREAQDRRRRERDDQGVGATGPSPTCSPHAAELGIGRELGVSDFHVEVIDLLANRVEIEIGVAFFTAMMSALRSHPLAAGLVVLGDMSVQGNLKPVRSLVEPLQVAKDNGAKRALIPIENKRSFLEVDADIVEHVDPVFYGDPRTAALKALGAT